MQHVRPSSTGGAGSPEPQLPLGRVVLAATAVVVAFQNEQSAHPVVQALLLTLLCVLSRCSRPGWPPPTSPGWAAACRARPVSS